MLKAIMSTWTLFFGLLLISAGSGLQVVLLGTRAPEAGFTNIDSKWQKQFLMLFQITR